MKVVDNYNYGYTQSQNVIKDVAIYLRKSRGEEEDLEKHRMALVEMCKIKGWRYIEYAEVGTADSLVFRPQMRKLLDSIEDEMFDAVLVVDMDRLSRGDGEEQAKIKNIIRRSGTYIITPQKTYDLNNESDDMYSDFEGLMARVEYKQIKKRFRRGKRQGSMRGDWTNGTPPFPYVYQQYYDEKNGKMYTNEKGLVVNKEKYEIYRFMIDKVLLEYIPPNQIAWELNRRGILSPRGGRWHGHTVQRILLDETHLGKIISNKTSGDGHKIKKSKDSKDVIKNPREEWIIVENCHEAIKTEEEHNKLILFFSRKTKAPKRKTKNTYTLSNLIKCAKCGHTMGFTRYETNSGYTEGLLRCWYKDELGVQCTNKGGKVSLIQSKIMDELFIYENELKISLNDNNTNTEENQAILREVNMTLNELARLDKKICKIDELVEDDYYTPQEAKERKQKLKKQIDEEETRLELLRIKLDNSEKVTIQEKLNIIEKFKENMKKKHLTIEEINENYKTILSYIAWERTEDEINIDVNFL